MTDNCIRQMFLIVVIRIRNIVKFQIEYLNECVEPSHLRLLSAARNNDHDGICNKRNKLLALRVGRQQNRCMLVFNKCIVLNIVFRSSPNELHQLYDGYDKMHRFLDSIVRHTLLLLNVHHFRPNQRIPDDITGKETIGILNLSFCHGINKFKTTCSRGNDIIGISILRCLSTSFQ